MNWPTDYINTIVHGDALAVLRQMPDRVIQTCITSPPFWGLRDYGVEGQLGLERTPELYVAKIVEVFREVRRVLRDDGTLWLNLGDSYVNHSMPGGGDPTIGRRNIGGSSYTPTVVPGLKPKDLVGIPWLVAFALRSDGWYLRSDIIWHKKNPMPESVTDRPTKAHEYLFLLAKSQRYFYDADAIREPGQDWGKRDRTNWQGRNIPGQKPQLGCEDCDASGGRNKRSVWTIATEPHPYAHFATFPIKLVEPCILAGSAETACGVCGAPYERIVETIDTKNRLGESWHDHKDDLGRGQRGCPPAEGAPERKTTGFRPTCDHDDNTGRSIILDPFMGSGTTGLRAQQLRRQWVGIELSQEYIDIAKQRLCQKELFNEVADG